MTANPNDFRATLKNGNSVLGLFMKTCDPAFVEIAGFAGFDFVILDMEHGPASLETMQNHLRAAQTAGVLPVVRVSELDEVKIAQVLDIGAPCVQIPQIHNAQQAETAVRAAKYHPAGERGLCRFVRAANYSALWKSEYLDRANQVLVILQLEGKPAIENIDDILTVEGIDIIFIGPYDLSQSLGMPGEVTHPEVVKQMHFIADKAKTKGIVVGTFADSEEYAGKWLDTGIQYMAYSVDVAVFLQGCQQIVAKLSTKK